MRGMSLAIASSLALMAEVPFLTRPSWGAPKRGKHHRAAPKDKAKRKAQRKARRINRRKP